jgi:hypothetical protein
MGTDHRHDDRRYARPQDGRREPPPPGDRRRGRRPDRPDEPQHVRQFFATHSHSWRDVGLARQLSRRAVKRARIQSLVLLPMLAGMLVVYGHRHRLFGSAYDDPVRIVTFLVLISLGWQFARDVGRGSARRCSGASIPARPARSASCCGS